MTMENHYEYRHTAGFEENDIADNVHHVNHPRWQGSRRERLLQERAPEVPARPRDDLRPFTPKAGREFPPESAAQPGRAA
ncbi:MULTISPECIES: hypothetical protein [Thermomonospora]|uniref:Uncharacterized protein n=1 Tax=Thermomonospora cellulosilytica TaxID=1411118 RepID=A0A7W3N139_9ACTN|nr:MULTISPECIES: hypothetical protein [Thermomonospora]MBA9005604.1 hypothetical protein [Thermomonospora cellulosilytica]